jgi:glycine/D-amino acid oxidase-like deaminating enzyme
MALYIRATGENLLVGGWEPSALDTDPRSYSIHESAPEIRPDTAVLDSFEQRFSKVFPKARGAARSRIAKGWPTFTPDGAFIIGESSLAPGFVMAGGCNAHGISGSAGIGRLLVESLLETKPSNYVRSLSPDRFTGSSWTWEEATRSARRIYETYYGTDLC